VLKSDRKRFLGAELRRRVGAIENSNALSRE
jgi:hypothetical protein